MDPWEQDRLGYKAIGETFTNLIKSIDSEKVISIEAGFGRGKTFFRKAWAEHLRQAGEVVIEIDVQQSDHSGDPVVTLLGALVEALPRMDDDKGKKAIDSAKKLGAIGARTFAKIVLRSAADELIDAATDTVLDKLEDFDTLDELINELGDGMSKAAGQFIAAQMAAERVRKKELPLQIKALQAALLQKAEGNRVIIVIDELDRCHPNYAIAFLEAMKLVFNQSGFVFCLMVNAEYLEKLAQHRFGVSPNDEKYLDKFVDIRFRLRPQDDNFKNAVLELASELPLAIPYGESESFSVEHAAELASKLAVYSELSIRKVKRIILKTEIALRCYKDRPLDASLLVFLAFQDETSKKIPTEFLPRSFLTPDKGREMMDRGPDHGPRGANGAVRELNDLIRQSGPELLELPRDRYQLPGNEEYYGWALVFAFLAQHYVPSHQDVLNAVGALIVPTE
tara:strand:+ start:294 stop:1649 length:1356 start_codon:yes stop_codon:yes gene_type:complete